MTNTELMKMAHRDLVNDVVAEAVSRNLLIEAGPVVKMTPAARLELRRAIRCGDYRKMRNGNIALIDEYPAFGQWCENEAEVGAWH